MFCSQCGAKVKEGDKFCPKCGHSVPKETDKDDKKETPVAGSPKPASSCSKSCAWAILILFFIALLGFVIVYLDKIKSSTELKWGVFLLAVVFIFLFSWGLFRRQKKSVKESIKESPSKSSKSSGTCLTVIVIVAIIAICAFGLIFLVGDYVETHPDDDSSPKSTHTSTPSKKTNNTSTPAVADWDGNYDAQMTKPNCDSSVELTSFQVSDNQVVNLWGTNGPIGNDNRAEVVFNTGTTMTVNFIFSSSNGKAVSSGTWSTSRGCSGTFSAIKTW